MATVDVTSPGGVRARTGIRQEALCPADDDERPREKPDATSRNALRFPPQATAIAAMETPYSRIKVPADDPGDDLAEAAHRLGGHAPVHRRTLPVSPQ
jgi:hypothetical protein